MSESMRKGLGMFGSGFLLALILGGLGMVGTGDYEQAVADQALYCRMVAEGAWPESPDYQCEQPAQDDPEHLASL